VFPKFITELLGDFKVDGGKFHIAGMSNGSLSAFLIASLYPRYFQSLTGFPGLLNDATAAKLKALAGDGAARLFNQFDEASHGCHAPN